VKTRRSITTICASARVIALSILFGGSSAIVFAAITFVRTARLHGMSVSQAASYNAPIFLAYSKIVLAAAIILVISELVEYCLAQGKPLLSQTIRYGAEVGCFAATLVFSLAIVPAMEKLMPQLTESSAAYDAFQKLHHWSELYFAGMILFALISLVAPAFRKD
jgi:hypothetical protein